MVSGAAANRGVIQPATDASPTPGTSQAPRSASLLELAEEHDKPSHVSLVGLSMKNGGVFLVSESLPMFRFQCEHS